MSQHPTVTFKCPCGRTLVAGAAAGANVRCPACGRTLAVPGAMAAPSLPPAIPPVPTASRMTKTKVILITSAVVAFALIALLLVAVLSGKGRPKAGELLATGTAPGMARAESGDPWEVILPTGRGTLRTEGFELQPKFHVRNGPVRYGRSANKVELKLTVYGEKTPRAELRIRLQERTTDVGKLVASLHSAPTERSSGENLLEEGKTPLIGPRQRLRFMIRFAERGNNESIVQPRPVEESYGDTLRSLDSAPPRIVAAAHIFTVFAEITTGKGGIHRVYSDSLYALTPRIDTLLTKLVCIDSTEARLIDSFLAKSPDEYTKWLLEEAVKTYAETMAYELAVKEKVVPPGFDENAVSRYCYNGDPRSPFRKPGAKPDESTEELRVLEEKFPRRTTPRSNVVDVFVSLRDKHPPLWAVVKKTLDRLAADGANKRLASKARFVKERLEFRESGESAEQP